MSQNWQDTCAIREKHKHGGCFHTWWSSQWNSRPVRTSAALLYHTAGTQSRIRFKSELSPAESLQALLICIILPSRSRKWFFERHAARRAKVFLFFLLQPSYLQWVGRWLLQVQDGPSLTRILTFTGNNRTHLAAGSDSRSCPGRPAAAATSFPHSFATPLLWGAGTGVSNRRGDVRDTQHQSGGVRCLEQSCTGRWNHLVISACVS